jgi:NAD(P)-dependent dehydrogenase (short-subunit alcohol dehydrogenase family)
MTSSTISQTPPCPAFLAYGIAKAAMNYLCANVSMEGPSLTSLCICPGIVDTEMQMQVRENPEFSMSVFGAEADNLRTIFPDKKPMPPEFYKFLEDLYHNKELLCPEQLTATYVRMALEGIPTDAVGKVLDWDDQRIQ